jgi:uncharacterized protein YjbI with pentapeptide repeats
MPTAVTSRLKTVSLFFALLAVIGAVVCTTIDRSEWAFSALLLTAVFTAPVLLPATINAFLISPLGQNWQVTLAVAITMTLLWVLGRLTRLDDPFWAWFSTLNWELGVPGAIGATGQLIIAVLAVWVAGKQNEITEKLTSQQNAITQQQTIDAYFQGISDLVLDDEGQMEDWPLERLIAQARTSALLGGCDAEGRAKVIRFLSTANLLTPLKRDGLLGRPILDGSGGYEVDVVNGVRVVNLGTMLAGKDMSFTDLRFTDLSGANLMKTNLAGCNLTGANLAGAILVKANLRGAELGRVRLFYGELATCTPRDRQTRVNILTGESTGAVVEDVDLTGVQDLSPENRYYFCAWGGAKTRRTVPGGCAHIPNRLLHPQS